MGSPGASRRVLRDARTIATMMTTMIAAQTIVDTHSVNDHKFSIKAACGPAGTSALWLSDAEAGEAMSAPKSAALDSHRFVREIDKARSRRSGRFARVHASAVPPIKWRKTRYARTPLESDPLLI